jgi:hypothetical protein
VRAAQEKGAWRVTRRECEERKMNVVQKAVKAAKKGVHKTVKTAKKAVEATKRGIKKYR